MFKKAERLTRAQFSEFFKTGKRFNFGEGAIAYSAHPKLHVAVVVGKKVAKKAHDRNAIRRRVYGRLYTALKGKSTGVYIVLLKPNFTNLTANEQRESVQKALTRITMSPTR